MGGGTKFIEWETFTNRQLMGRNAFLPNEGLINPSTHRIGGDVTKVPNLTVSSRLNQ
jgi:hypothetical protein